MQYEATLQRTLDDRARERTAARVAAERGAADAHAARADAKAAADALAPPGATLALPTARAVEGGVGTPAPAKNPSTKVINL